MMILVEKVTLDKEKVDLSTNLTPKMRVELIEFLKNWHHCFAC